MPAGEPAFERGTYQRELISYTSLTQVVGTEYELAMVATKLLASGADERIKWARFHVLCFDIGQFVTGEWMLYKCLSTDADIDMNTAATIELLQKRGNLLKRGYYVSSKADYGKLQGIKFEIYNVDLNDGEELRLLIRPIQISGANTFNIQGELEYRIAGV